MGREFVNQHIAPRRYLDRFASVKNGKHIIGTRLCANNNLRFFTAPTSDVGYIKNFYDVTDKDDPRYWEHFFAREIDVLCGREMNNIISAIMMSQVNSKVLSEQSKRVLSRVIIAQMMRVPSSVDYVKEIYPKVEQTVKDRIFSIIPEDLKNRYGQKIRDVQLDEQWQKEQFFNTLFKPENFKRYCNIMQNNIWVVLFNAQRAFMPFVTSDNPVLVEGVGKKEIGIFHNGLANPTTCIFYPISPSIAVANYSKDGIMGVRADELDGRIIIVNEMKYIMDKNIKIIDQAYQHSFIPQPLFDMIVSGTNTIND